MSDDARLAAIKSLLQNDYSPGLIRSETIAWLVRLVEHQSERVRELEAENTKRRSDLRASLAYLPPGDLRSRLTVLLDEENDDD